MSERRQLALLLVGLVALVGIGIGGAALFPEQCTGLEQLGDLQLAFADASDALQRSDADGDAVEALGEELGIGPWRGAVALPDDARVLPSEFGFFVVTDEDFTVLRPSIGIASASRGRVGLDLLPAGTSLALRATTGETGLFNGEYELDRCGELPPDTEVLSLARGLAVVASDGPATERGVGMLTLSGDEVWTVGDGVEAAHILDERVLLAMASGELRLVDVRSGETLDEVTATNRLAGWWWVDDLGAVVHGDGGPRLVQISDDGLEVAAEPLVSVPVGDSVSGVARTLAGLVVLTTSQVDGTATGVLTLEGGATAMLPDGVVAVGIDVSQDGHTGLLLEVEGERALVVYGPQPE